MIPWFKPHFHGDEKEYVSKALESTWISDGEYVWEFESRLAELLNTENFLTTSNGTASLHLALLTMGIQPGDEIIIPGYTFAAPANMAISLGAKPVFADIDPDTWMLDVNSVMEKLSPKTRAVVPAHLYGNVCDMEPLTKLAKAENFHVIEDTAEAFLSSYKGRFAGTIGDVGCFSFQATKTITTGEGGGVTFRDPALVDNARLFRSHGMAPEKRYWHQVIGHNFRLTNMQAALGCSQLNFVDEIIENKKRIDARYRRNLSGLTGVKLQQITSGCDSVMWAFAMCLEDSVKHISRDEVMVKLKGRGIESRPGFTSFSAMPIYDTSAIPVSDNVSRRLISLPSYTQLSDNEIDLICEVLSSILIPN